MTEFEYSVQIDEFIYYPAKGLTQLTGQRICLRFTPTREEAETHLRHWVNRRQESKLPLLNPIIVRREKAEQKPIEVVGS